MTFNELLPTIQALPRAEKLRLIQYLAADVASEEGEISDAADKPVAIWSPYDAFEGAETLLKLLDEDKAAS